MCNQEVVVLNKVEDISDYISKFNKELYLVSDFGKEFDNKRMSRSSRILTELATTGSAMKDTLEENTYSS